jgi:hypothetical protein
MPAFNVLLQRGAKPFVDDNVEKELDFLQAVDDRRSCRIYFGGNR